MTKKKQYREKKLAVIEDMFTGEFDVQAILDKYKVSRNIYNKWLTEPDFIELFNGRIAAYYRQSELIIARYAPLAAAKLVQLTESQKEETARKACLDIISLPKSCSGPGLEGQVGDSEQPNNLQGIGAEQSQPFSPETASKLLAVLAEDQEKRKQINDREG